MFKFITLALATSAVALPAPQSGSAIGAKPDASTEFALAMKVDDQLVSLNAVTNGTVGNLVLEAQRLSVYPGTPAYLNGTGEYKALNFVLDDGVYGAGVPDVGDNYGYAGSAFAIFGYQQFEWLDGPTGVSHKLQAALNTFYACRDTVNGAENYVLKWGVQGVNGQPPVGCQPTSLTKNFNVPGGARAPATYDA